MLQRVGRENPQKLTQDLIQDISWEKKTAQKDFVPPSAVACFCPFNLDLPFAFFKITLDFFFALHFVIHCKGKQCGL